MLSLARRAVGLLALIALICGVCAFAVPLVWTPEPADGPLADARWYALLGFGVLLVEVFAFHGGLAMLGFAALALVCRFRMLALALAAVGMIHAAPGLVRVAGAISSAPPAPGPAGQPVLTVVSHNMLFSSASLDAIADIVDREQPDVIMIQEVVRADARALFDRFGSAYPHRVSADSHRWGAVLLSRHPFIEIPDPLPGQPAWSIDQPIGVIEFDGVPVTLMSVHLPSPNRIDQLVAGPQMTGRLADWIETQSDRPAGGERAWSAVFAGDFNAPLWTRRMSALREAGLVSAHDAAGAGRGATWPARTPLRFAPGIRLDQALFTGDLRCIDARVLESTGSDHRPIVARFVRDTVDE